MRRGGIGLCVATQIARYVKRANALPGWHSPEQAWAMTQAQLAWYREMERRGEMRAITTRAALDAHLARWAAAPDPLADQPADRLHAQPRRRRFDRDARAPRAAWRDGLRAVGPAHYGPGTYAQGTDATGGIGAIGRELLKEMERLGIILDVTHLCDDSFWEALDLSTGASGPATRTAARSCRTTGSSATTDPRTGRSRRGHRRRARRLDAGPGWARRDDAAGRGRDARRRWSITSTTSVRSPATRITSGSAAISTADSAASRPRRISRRSRIWRDCRSCSPRAAMPPRMSRASHTEISWGSCGGSGSSRILEVVRVGPSFSSGRAGRPGQRGLPKLKLGLDCTSSSAVPQA